MCFLFFQIGHIGQFWNQISSVAPYVELTEFTEFLDNIIKMPVFKAMYNFLKF